MKTSVKSNTKKRRSKKMAGKTNGKADAAMIKHCPMMFADMRRY